MFSDCYCITKWWVDVLGFKANFALGQTLLQQIQSDATMAKLRTGN